VTFIGVKFSRLALSVALVGLIPVIALRAGTISVDPNGRGSINGQNNSGYLSNDPGPGGLDGVLTYLLQFSGVQGDVFLTFADYNNIPLDVIRFNGDGTLIYYAANVDGGPNLLADTPSPPGSLYPNAVELDEVTPHGGSLVIYTPAAGQPGYDASNPTYDIYTYSAPEPSSLDMFLIAGLAAAGWQSGGRRLSTTRGKCPASAGLIAPGGQIAG
jgi:hypothetical protein